MGPRPIGTPDPVVDVTYDCKGERKTKRFASLIDTASRHRSQALIFLSHFAQPAGLHPYL